jgi:hypothetical protein
LLVSGVKGVGKVLQAVCLFFSEQIYFMRHYHVISTYVHHLEEIMLSHGKYFSVLVLAGMLFPRRLVCLAFYGPKAEFKSREVIYGLLLQR